MIKRVRVFDGMVVIEETDLLVEEGIIRCIQPNIKPKKVDHVINGEGKTLLPGLINAHVHAWLPYHLKDAFKAGVFAVLDMHSPREASKTLKELQLEDGYARFYSSGSAATVARGHGTQFGYRVPVVGANRSPAQFVKEAIENESDYIKIIYEPRRPTLMLEQVQSLIEESHRNDLLAVAHISKYAHAEELVALDIDGLVHLWKDALLTEDFVSELQAKEVFIIPTLSVIEGVIDYYQSNGIDNDISPLEDLLKEVKQLVDAEISVLAGTDPPNVLLDYGPSLHHEMELFVKAGLTPIQALKAATSNPSKAFSIPEIGTIQIGQEANFILVEGNPTINIKDTRNIISLWVKGKEIKP